MRFTPKFVATLISLSVLGSPFAATNPISTVNLGYKEEVSHFQRLSPSRIYMGTYGGYGVINGAYKNDGDVAFGRLTLGLHAYEYRYFLFGTELGLQSGNTMRLETNSTVTNALGGLQPQASLKPFVDFLITAQGKLANDIPLFGILKAGIAYRQLQLEISTSSRDTVRKINGELQIGLGYNLTEHAMLTAFYQGIYSGSDAGVSVDASGDNTYINRIPTQQAGFLGIEYSL